MQPANPEDSRPRVKKGPNIEEFVFTHFQQKPEMYEGMERVYLPVFWAALMRSGPDGWRAALQSTINGLDTKQRYWTVVQLPGGLSFPRLAMSLPPGLDVLVFSSGGLTMGAKNVVIPLLKGRLDQEPPATKTIAVSFIGSADAGPTRKALASLYKDDWFFYPGGQDWRAHLLASRFTLCPTGFGQASFRLAEAVEAQAVPIYVYESVPVLPFLDTIDWEGVAIVVPATEIRAIGALVRDADAAAMRAAVAKIQHMFTREYTAKYIAGILSTNADGPFVDGDGNPISDSDGSGRASAAAGDQASLPGNSQQPASEQTGQTGRGAGGSIAAAAAADQASTVSSSHTDGGVSGSSRGSGGGDGTQPERETGPQPGDERLTKDQASQHGTAGFDATFDAVSGGRDPAGSGGSGGRTRDQSSGHGTQRAESGDSVAASDHVEKVRAKQRMSGVASLVQAEGGVDRATAVENAKTFMEPRSPGRLAEDIDTLEDGSGSSGIGTVSSGDGSGSGGGGDTVTYSIANSKQVAEITARMADAGEGPINVRGQDDEVAPRQEPATGGSAGGSVAAGVADGGSGGGGAAGGSGSPGPDRRGGDGDEPNTPRPEPETVWDAKAGRRVPVAAPGGGSSPAEVGSAGTGKAAADSGSATAAVQKKQASQGGGETDRHDSTAAQGKSGGTVWDPKQGRRVPVGATR